MVKLTKRKGFNFFRSYYDVYNELSDKAKVEFMDALLDRQFLGVKPTDLKGMAKFAYISQTNSIDSQVKGYEDKSGIKLTPCQGGVDPPTPQVQVEVQEKGEEKVEGKEKEKKRLVFPFDSENFKNQWEIWKKYKQEEFKFKYKSIISEQGALKKLSKIAETETTAIEIIHQSIENGWKGFFSLHHNGEKGKDVNYTDYFKQSMQKAVDDPNDIRNTWNQ